MDRNESIEVGRQDEDSLLVGKWGCRGAFHCRERFHQTDGVRHVSDMQCVLTYTHSVTRLLLHRRVDLVFRGYVSTV
jgi:hypothetical protein